MTHHDMDAPPWWHFQRKKMLYIDGFADKGHRGLMQFMLVRQNGPEKFREWEDDFRDVFAYIGSLEPPKYPYPVDEPLAERGRVAFNRVCAECHGTYGTGGSYPGEARAHRRSRHRSRAARSLSPGAPRRLRPKLVRRLTARSRTIGDPGGYVAPPLDGIWASAPYFHNGSVPTLWHVLHPGERPAVWKRTGEQYDFARLGLPIETFDQLPAHAASGPQRREYFDTRAFGKSAKGHDFPAALSADEKLAVLEYSKTCHACHGSLLEWQGGAMHGRTAEIGKSAPRIQRRDIVLSLLSSRPLLRSASKFAAGRTVLYGLKRSLLGAVSADLVASTAVRYSPRSLDWRLIRPASLIWEGPCRCPCNPYPLLRFAAARSASR